MESAAPLGTYKPSDFFVIRNATKLATRVELNLYLEEWFIHPTMKREVVCFDAVSTGAFTCEDRNSEMMSYLILPFVGVMCV